MSDRRIDDFGGFDPQAWERVKAGEKVPGPLTGQALGQYAFQEMLI